MTSFCVNLEGPRLDEDEQAIETAAIAMTTAATNRIDLHMGSVAIITPGMEAILTDVRLGLRRLRLSPGFTLFAVASLALGIGVTTAVYSAVRTFFWMPRGIAAADELTVVSSRLGNYARIAWPDFGDLQTQQTVFRSLIGDSQIRTAVVSSHGAEIVAGDAVSGSYFGTLGAGVRHGRLLTPNDERDASRVVVLSERFWRTHFHGDSGAIGQIVRLGGEAFEIVGVVKEPFHGIDRFVPRSIWVPITAVPQPGDRGSSFGFAARLTDRNRGVVRVLGRLKPGVLPDRARSEVNLIGQRLDAAFPLDRERRREWSLKLNATEDDSEAARTVSGMILTGVGMLLLIACSNLANLALAKGTSRSEETAVRSALGASRWRLVREQLIESSMVVLAGGALGVWLLTALIDLFTIDFALGRGLVMTFRPEVSAPVLASAIVSMVLAVLVFGLWPAVQGTRADVRARIGAASSTPPRWGLHRTLVAWQVCGCVALTLVAAMSHRILSTIDRNLPGVPTVPVAVAEIDFSMNARDENQTRRTVDALLAGLRAQPGIDRAVASAGLPFAFFGAGASYFVTTPDALASQTGDLGQGTAVIPTTPGLFEAYDLPILRGRPFTDRDDAAAPRVAVISERLARTLFRSIDVVGRTVIIGRTRASTRGAQPETLTIVAVSGNPDGAPRTSRGQHYLFVPWTQRYERGIPVTLTARGASPSAIVGALRSTIHRVDSELAVTASGTGRVLLQGPLFVLRVIAALSTALAATSLVLAMAGLFGVLSHVVMRRTREIGIRLALGADRGRIFRWILRDGLHPVAKGIVLGLTIGAGARMAVSAWVVTDISAFEPLAFALIPVPFILAALAACYLPAARASRVDPNTALRDL
jgi:putative ABC transport system permease protein